SDGGEILDRSGNLWLTAKTQRRFAPTAWPNGRMAVDWVAESVWIGWPDGVEYAVRLGFP
ncbi:MAG: hypothetical protein NTX45_05160, partial [Proteobacteria bacterium]|nr:hypothetical protein [Pseudomonadota bacterium]